MYIFLVVIVRHSIVGTGGAYAGGYGGYGAVAWHETSWENMEQPGSSKKPQDDSLVILKGLTHTQMAFTSRRFQVEISGLRTKRLRINFEVRSQRYFFKEFRDRLSLWALLDLLCPQKILGIWRQRHGQGLTWRQCAVPFGGQKPLVF